MRFFMAMEPPTATHQKKKVTVGKDGKPRFYEPAEVKQARAKLNAYLARHVPPAPAGGPLCVTVKWLFPLSGKTPRDGDWAVNAPDCHNLNKLLFDCMTALKFWGDDKQVCSELIQKFWASTPGIFIQIEPLTNNQEKL